MNKTKWYRSIRYYRWLVQGFILFFIIYLIMEPFIHKGAESVSPEAYCPLGGLASLIPFITEGKTLPHIHSSNLIILGIIVLLTVLMRSGFCSWICPFGTIQDFIRKLGTTIGKQKWFKPINRSYKGMIKKLRPQLQVADRYLRLIKFLVLAWILYGAIFYTELVFRNYDPFIALVKIFELEGIGGLIILLVFGILSLFIDRPWCKYACPLGAFIGIIGKVSPLRIKRDEKACINCNLCTKSCPMNIDVAHSKHVTSMDCNHCMTCIDSCPAKGALNLGIITPKSKQNWVETGENYEK